MARARWLERGFAAPIAGAVGSLAAERGAGSPVLDIGCGDGFFLAALAAGRGFAASQCAGVDLSAEAIRRAARRMPGALWLVSNADRGLPFADGTFGLVLSLFGRRPAPEIARVLRPGGCLIAAVPGSDDLGELRAAVMGAAKPLPGAATLEQDLGGAFDTVASRSLRWGARLDREAITDALAMTYRGARNKVRQRAAKLDGLDVALSAEIGVFAPRV